MTPETWQNLCILLALATAYAVLDAWQQRRNLRRLRIRAEEAEAWADEYQREAAALDAECVRLRNQVATLQMLYAERTRELLAVNFRIIATNVAWKRRRTDSEKE